jgi:hypothetical protein
MPKPLYLVPGGSRGNLKPLKRENGDFQGRARKSPPRRVNLVRGERVEGKITHGVPGVMEVSRV